MSSRTGALSSHALTPRRRGFLSIAYALLVYSFIFLPVVVLVMFSFQESRVPVPPFNGPTLKWYAEVLSDTRLTETLLNSVLVAFVSSFAALLLGFAAAYGLARQPWRFSVATQSLLTAPLTVSYLIIAMGLLITFNTMGIAKSLWTVGVGHVVINLPLCFAIVYSQLGEHQAVAERAARDLGASEWQVIALVTVPMIWPALFASFFLSFTLSWDEFIIAFMLSRFEVTLPVEIWGMLRSGLNPKTNAVGSLVFLVSAAAVFLLEIVVLRNKTR